ncbi:MAG: alpha/beta hydrolase [Candidatus Tokpelaia sp.]|nr:MAG: alpha/beta hydrolase [Candidatus Tokpelaia sp.]KAA6206826.1 MAG: alpha/beta hydrolase [Candidatus Tokpelaia sp.]
MPANISYSSLPKTVPPVEFLPCGPIAIALRHRPAATQSSGPGRQTALLWLGGYRSDMEGTKAQAVDAFAEAHGLEAVRFDYSGHGRSGGDFYQGTISLWLAQSLAVFNRFYRATTIKPILVGSSMGGWIALRLAQELQMSGRSPGGLILLAPAPDFTEILVKPALQPAQTQQLKEKGFFTVSENGFETPYSQALLADGRQNCVLNNGLLQLDCPVHIVQGMADDSVPYRHTMRLMEYLPLDNVTLTLIKDGDHRLSQPQHLVFLQKLLENFISFI